MTSCSGSKVKNWNSEAAPPSHAIWDDLLQKHVGDQGSVDYKGFIADSSQFNSYLELLSNTPPNANKWSKEAQMAYWINVYNAFTIKIVADNYPVASIKDIGPNLSIPFVNTVWDIKFIEIGGETFDLNNVEHSMLRKQFHDPRVHFAVVCASYSCPRLLNRAFTADKLDEQLDYLAKDFLSDARKNKVTPSKLELSKIFSWYKGDFLDKEIKSIQAYISQYTDVQVDPEAEIVWQEYKWSLNENAK